MNFLINYHLLINRLLKTSSPIYIDDEYSSEVVAVYPLPPATANTISITKGDLKRLLPIQYLNDNLIDYYMRTLEEKFTTHDTSSLDFTCFTSHFYTKMIEFGSRSNPDVTLGYQQVSKWTSNMDIFSKHAILVPINIQLHWSLAIICNPMGFATEGSDFPTAIVLLDSLGAYHKKSTIFNVLRR